MKQLNSPITIRYILSSTRGYNYTYIANNYIMHDALLEPAAEVSAKDTARIAKRAKRAKRALLGCTYVVLFLRYSIATFLSSFFPTVPPGNSFSGTMVGLIFAAYPLGMALTSSVAPLAIMRLGTRVSVYFGLMATSALTVLFGLAPDVVPPGHEGSTSLQAIFFVAYFLNGALGALAETACLVLVAAKFKDNVAATMASVNTVCTVGCMLGPVVGGVLYSLPASKAEAFRLPFLVCGAIPLAALPFIHASIPQEHISGEEAEGAAGGASCSHEPQIAEAGAVQGPGCAPASPPPPTAASTTGMTLPLTPSIAIGLLSIGLSGTIVGTLDPTLSWRCMRILGRACVPRAWAWTSWAWACA